MKKIVFMLVFMTAIFLQNSSAQDKTVTANNILNEYYAIKDALVSGNAALANSKALGLVKIATDDATLPEANRAALIKDAASIAKTKDIKKQREYFSVLSDNMFGLAKATKLDTKPVYKAYCPMVKASWLSNSASIKNPYYGSAMLTCGSVVETLK